MNRSPFLLPLATISLFGAAQAPIAFSDKKGTTLRAANGVIDQESGGRFRFDLTGSVSGTSESQGVRFAAQRAKGALAPDPARKGALRLTDLELTGGVKIVRTRTEKGATTTTTLTSTGATYDVGAGDSAQVTTRGDVAIVEAGPTGTTTLTGDNGRAALSSAGAGTTSLKNATMTGNVKIKARQRDTAGKLATYNASGDRLEYVAAADGGATVTMTGNLKFDSPDAGDGGGGFITGATKAILTLNAAKEVTRVRLSSGGAQNGSTGKVRATFKTGRKGLS